jgi:hypothetical protein
MSTVSAWREQVREGLKRFCSFPSGHPTDAEVDQIATDVLTHERAIGRAAYQSDVEQIARACVPGTRFIRTDGLNFQDIKALLATIRAQAAQAKK